MTRPDLMEEARKACGTSNVYIHSSTHARIVERVASALLAAEARGREEATKDLSRFIPNEWDGTDPIFGHGCTCDKCNDARLVHARRAALLHWMGVVG